MARSGTTLFCDDIRQEVGGKLSLIGCYGSDLLISGAEFPLMLPKLGFLVKLLIPESELPREVSVHIYLPQDEDVASFQGAIEPPSKKILDELAKRPKPRDAGPRIITITQQYTLSPVPIQRPGFVRVRVNCDGDMLRVGAILVRADEA